jgi:chromosomal replication initiator protein
MALARGEREGLSPLVLYGPAGAGKSRLLEGLVAEVISRRPDVVVAHLAAEAFASACAEAAGQSDGWRALRSRFRKLDLFVLDDLYALERAPLALGELAHTLDALTDAGAAVAVSARAGPGQWTALPRRLVNRLVGGLAVRVALPGLDMRRRYVLDQTRQLGLTLAAEAVEAMAASADAYRTLDGLLARLAIEAKLQGTTKGQNQFVQAALAEVQTVPATELEHVVRNVAARFGVTVRDLRSSSRRRGLVVPRHLAISLAREATGLSFAVIGRYFGHRDAATVRHACQASAKRLAADTALAAVAAALRRSWKPNQTAAPSEPIS